MVPTEVSEQGLSEEPSEGDDATLLSWMRYIEAQRHDDGHVRYLTKGSGVVPRQEQEPTRGRDEPTAGGKILLKRMPSIPLAMTTRQGASMYFRLRRAPAQSEWNRRKVSAYAWAAHCAKSCVSWALKKNAAPRTDAKTEPIGREELGNQLSTSPSNVLN